jgi:transcriptional regulator with XRE-family HTH domain
MISNLSREQFIGLLNQRREEFGSSQKLADAMGVPIRSIFRWVRGEGPSYGKMQRAYERLKSL